MLPKNCQEIFFLSEYFFSKNANFGAKTLRLEIIKAAKLKS